MRQGSFRIWKDQSAQVRVLGLDSIIVSTPTLIDSWCRLKHKLINDFFFNKKKIHRFTYQVSFYLSSALLNKLAKCFCSFFAEIMISPAFINSLFCYEDCFPHFRCHRYFWKKNDISRWLQNDSWTALLETTLFAVFIRLRFKFAELGKIFVFQTIVCFFVFRF